MSGHELYIIVWHNLVIYVHNLWGQQHVVFVFALFAHCEYNISLVLVQPLNSFWNIFVRCLILSVNPQVVCAVCSTLWSHVVSGTLWRKTTQPFKIGRGAKDWSDNMILTSQFCIDFNWELRMVLICSTFLLDVTSTESTAYNGNSQSLEIQVCTKVDTRNVNNFIFNR